ncbi:TetR/AcrR family transcriptional regulator [Streptococcus suis]|uniref:TetR/AcrR family transcriptional regulator n=1 Tax=Streptococcus suis TaxID=1307 RepID=UPI0019225FF7|nr:TetR/AcrR family transcriptional regulator [Streptococcus suis]MBL1124961.1 TetR/AcrR family transcriptional regulator [Streptococcus suis]HEM3633575.1 TetR/AcrR family transcriptional regulator [Streptococcus suis]
MVYQQKREKTEQAIKETLVQLLKQQSIHTINVTDIANTAGVNRVTIYRHFADKWEILESIEGDVLASLVQPHQRLQLSLQETFVTGEDKTSIIEALTEFLRVFHQQLDRLQVLTSYQANLGFSNKLLKFMIELETRSHPYIHQRLSSQTRELFSYSIMSMLLGIIEYWTEHPTMTAEELANFIFNVRFGASQQLNQQQAE